MVLKSFTLLLVLCTLLFAGDPDRIKQVKTVAPYPQSMTIQNIWSANFSGVNHFFESNPANLLHFDTLSLGIRFDLGSKIHEAVYYDIHLQPARQWLPSAAIFVYNLSGVPLAIGFHKRYSEKIDFGEIELTTVTEPNGTGETITLDYSTEIYSYALSSGYKLSGLFSERDQINIGALLSLDHILMNEDMEIIESSVNDFNYFIKAGILYESDHNFSIGLMYEYNPEKTGEVEHKTDNLLIPEPTDIENSNYLAAPSVSKSPYRYKMPDKTAISVIFHPIRRLNLNLTVTRTFWEQVNDYLKNTWDYSFTTEYYFKNKIGLGLGVMSSYFRYSQADLSNMARNAYFFSTGLHLPLFKQLLSIQFLDSHLFSDDRRKQTIIKAGINYSFN